MNDYTAQSPTTATYSPVVETALSWLLARERELLAARAAATAEAARRRDLAVAAGALDSSRRAGAWR